MNWKYEKSQASWWRSALVLFVRFSGWIAFPVIVAVFVGKWLDRRYGSEPWLFLLCVGIAFIVSMVAIIKNAMEEISRIEADSRKTRNTGNDQDVKINKN